MRRMARSVAALAAVVAYGLFPIAPAGAAPGPNPEEWWFPSWGIQDKIWPITRGQGVTVAVIDTGVNAGLPDLAGVVVPGRGPAASGDGRTDTDSQPESHGHGTSMAITIAGQGGSNGWLGVAPDVKILPIVDTESDQASAIRYAVDHGASVINISEGSPNSCPEELQQAVSYAADRQVVVIASAGNTGDTGNQAMYPADCAGVLAVGGVRPDLTPWSGSQRQPYIAVSAPAYQVGMIGSDGVLYHDSKGTSGAAAFTSGLAALIRSRYPHLTARQVVQRIIATVHPLPGAVPNPATGYGAIRFTRALTAAVPANAPNPVFDALDQWRAAHAAAPPSDLGTAGPVAATPSPSHSTSAAMKILLDGGTFVLALAAAFGVRSLVRRNRRPVPPPPRNGPPGMPPSFGGGDPDRHLHN